MLHKIKLFFKAGFRAINQSAQRPKQYKKRRHMAAHHRKNLSYIHKLHWDNLSPEKRVERIQKMQAARKYKKAVLNAITSKG